MKNYFIPAEIFSRKYGVTVDNIYSYKYNHKHKNNGIKIVDGKLLIDEIYFIRRREFRDKIKNLAQENY